MLLSREIKIGEFPPDQQSSVYALSLDGIVLGTLPDGLIDLTELVTAESLEYFEDQRELYNSIALRFLGLEAPRNDLRGARISLTENGDGNIQSADLDIAGDIQKFQFSYDVYGHLSNILWRSGGEYFVGNIDYAYSSPEAPIKFTLAEFDPERRRAFPIFQQFYEGCGDIPDLRSIVSDVRNPLSRYDEELQRLLDLLTSRHLSNQRSGILELTSRLQMQGPELLTIFKRGNPAMVGKLFEELVVLNSKKIKGLSPQEVEEAWNLPYLLADLLEAETVATAIANIHRSAIGAACLSKLRLMDRAKYERIMFLLDLHDDSCGQLSTEKPFCNTTTGMPKRDEVAWMVEGVRFVYIDFVPDEWLKRHLRFYLHVHRDLLKATADLEPRQTLPRDFSNLKGGYGYFEVERVPKYYIYLDEEESYDAERHDRYNVVISREKYDVRGERPFINAFLCRLEFFVIDWPDDEVDNATE